MAKLGLSGILIFLIGSFLYHADIVHAQETELSDEAQFSLITILPGDLTEELFGHSAIRVKDHRHNIDISFNYGTFQFDSFFIAKFIYGDLNYFLSVGNFAHTVHNYRSRERPIIEQVLNLTSEQKQVLYQFLINNASEENRHYQYDFLFDNCSTRIRDALETVLGEDLQFVQKTDPRFTFRELIDLYVNHRSEIDLGIDLLLGSNIDRIAEWHELMFLPDFLLDAFDDATVLIDGEIQPLVSSKQTLLEIEGYEIEKNLPWVAIFFWILFLIGIAVTWETYRQKKVFNQWFDIPLYAISGLIGLLISFLWFISIHDETVNNLNLLWAWPTHFIIVPVFFKRSGLGRVVNLYFLVYAICCLIILIGWFFWTQELHPALIPLLLLHILRSVWIAYYYNKDV